MTETPMFDAIVVGSGISGGMAAKELTERGLKVLLLDRGRHVTHGEDYVGEDRPPWDWRFRGLGDRQLYASDYPIQSKARAFGEGSTQFFVNDREHPYETEADSPFTWIRGYHLGGRSLTWGRASFRLAPTNFEEPALDGQGIDWPFRYDDIAPWYSHVERFIGVTGERDGLDILPDGEFLKPMPLNCVEQHAKTVIEQRFPGRKLIPERSAVLSEEHNGRPPCHYCGPCYKGCSTASYFSSNGVSLPAAEATGRLTTVTDAIVASIDYDPAGQRVTGVNVIDAKTKERRHYSARTIFLNASTIGSVMVLLQSRSESFPNGLGNRNDQLGRYILDHAMGAVVTARIPGFTDEQPIGNRPIGIYIPRYENLNGNSNAAFRRGFGFQGSAWRSTWARGAEGADLGADLKNAMRVPGPWYMILVGFGETLPNAENRVTLSSKTDAWGLPVPNIRYRWSDNEKAIVREAARHAAEMLEACGGEIVQYADKPTPGGLAIHEMGGARMGRDPATSILNGHNQAHGIPNLFVTDGACMPATGNVNPSLTYMALTARAAAFAVDQMKAAVI